MKRLSFISMIFAGAAALPLGAAHAQAPALVGSWRGTSTCVDRAHYPACNDEQVIYDAALRAGSKDTVTLRADKIVNGAREFMAEFDFTPAADGSWVADVVTPRFHLRIILRISGTSMRGSLSDVTTDRQVRALVLARV